MTGLLIANIVVCGVIGILGVLQGEEGTGILSIIYALVNVGIGIGIWVC